LYLSEKQLKALDIASDALQGWLDSNVDNEKCYFAIDIIADMKIKARKNKQRKKNKKVSQQN